MALGANSEIEIREDGIDNNGGGFNTDAAGANWTLQAAAEVSSTGWYVKGVVYTRLYCTEWDSYAGTRAEVVGNWLHITAGGVFTVGWYEITAQGNDGANEYVDVETAPTATSGDSGGTGKVGGALLSIGALGRLCTNHGVSDWIAYKKTGTYTLTSTVANADGGPLYLDAPDYDKRLWVKGYDGTRSFTADVTTRPTINDSNVAGGASGMFWTDNLESTFLADVIFDCKGKRRGVSGINKLYMHCYRVKLIDPLSSGFDDCTLESCEVDAATTNPSYGAISCSAQDCYVHASVTATYGYYASDTQRCVANGFDRGFYLLTRADQCVAYDCQFAFDATSVNLLDNVTRCIAAGTTTTATTTGFDTIGKMSDNAYYNCTTPKTAEVLSWNFIECTATPFTDPANDDFSLNDTADGGALLKAQGFEIPKVVYTNNLDIGAIQHADPAGGGTVIMPNRPNSLLRR